MQSVKVQDKAASKKQEEQPAEGKAKANCDDTDTEYARVWANRIELEVIMIIVQVGRFCFVRLLQPLLKGHADNGRGGLVILEGAAAHPLSAVVHKVVA